MNQPLDRPPPGALPESSAVTAGVSATVAADTP